MSDDGCPMMGMVTMVRALHAEWVKLRTVSAPGLLLLAAIIGTVGLGAAASAAVSCPGAGCPADPSKVSLTGVLLGQVVIAVVAVLSVGGEYSSGMMSSTLIAMPARTGMLVAKAVTLTGPVLVAGFLAVFGSLVAGKLLLPPADFTGWAGYPETLGDPSTIRAATGSVLYLALIALLALGIATVVRSSAAAICIVLGLLFVLPILTAVVTDPDWQRHLKQIAPSTAGLAIQATSDLDSLPISPWAGLGVLGLWAAAALAIGAVVLQLRDA